MKSDNELRKHQSQPDSNQVECILIESSRSNSPLAFAKHESSSNDARFDAINGEKRNDGVEAPNACQPEPEPELESKPEPEPEPDSLEFNLVTHLATNGETSHFTRHDGIYNFLFM